MSVEAITWAFEREVRNGGQKFLLVALANEANKSGVTFVGQQLLAEACSCTRETVSRNMVALERAGLIARVQRRRGNGSRTSDYTILAPAWEDRGSMREAVAEEVPDAVMALTMRGAKSSRAESSRDEDRPRHVTNSGGPEPGEEPGALSVGARAKAKPVTYHGKRVPDETVAAAVHLLDVFCQAARRRIGSRDGTGGASPALKQIVGALMARPEVTAPEWEQAVRNTVASPPPWVDGQVQLGHVFGERAADHALVNPGKVKGATDPSGSSVQSGGVQTGDVPTGWENLDEAVRYD